MAPRQPLTPAQEICALLDSAGLSRRQSAQLLDVSPSLVQGWYAQSHYDTDLRTTKTTPRIPTIHMLKLARLIFETHDIKRDKALLFQLKREGRGGVIGRPHSSMWPDPNRTPEDELPPRPVVVAGPTKTQEKQSQVTRNRQRKASLRRGRKRKRQRARSAAGFGSRTDLQEKIAAALRGDTDDDDK